MAKNPKPKPDVPEPRLPPPPLTPRPGAEFKRDLKRLQKRGKDMQRLRAMIGILSDHRPLDSRHRDHALSSDWKGWRDCHVEPDWIRSIVKRRASWSLAAPVATPICSSRRVTYSTSCSRRGIGSSWWAFASSIVTSHLRHGFRPVRQHGTRGAAPNN